ncbi:uncharacterized protein [Rutidosis leptorrhynchoides]|uniref:uncharacterized protein n=1 Tax=Rutidosis leptorrhynchoides TaxID=125765 RepID=UPI003A98F441
MCSWKNVAEKLKEEHGFIADQRQMKNRFDYLKGKFNVWTKLHNKTGDVYDPVTKKFNLTKEEWEIEIKLNKYAEPLKNAPLLYPDLCAQLFDGATVTGLDGWGPASTLPHPQEAHDDLEINEEPLISTKEPNAMSQECSSTRSPTQSKKRKRKDVNHNIMVVAEDISNIANMMMEKHKGDDMSACIDKLEKLGWEPNNPMYETALLLFGESADFRKLWLVLKPESCESWIRNAGKKYGLLTFWFD